MKKQLWLVGMVGVVSVSLYGISETGSQSDSAGVIWQEIVKMGKPSQEYSFLFQCDEDKLRDRQVVDNALEYVEFMRLYIVGIDLEKKEIIKILAARKRREMIKNIPCNDLFLIDVILSIVRWGKECDRERVLQEIASDLGVPLSHFKPIAWYSKEEMQMELCGDVRKNVRRKIAHQPDAGYFRS